eukprot:Gb_20234 [translate_table: standard]
MPNLGGALGTAPRKPTTPPTTSFLPLDRAGYAWTFKACMCNCYGIAKGCRFGDKGPFAHGEKELMKGNTPPLDVERERMVGSFGNRPTPGRLDVRPSGQPSVNLNQSCRLTGAKLAVREYEFDSNVELEGTFDQIKQDRVVLQGDRGPTHKHKTCKETQAIKEIGRGQEEEYAVAIFF